MQTSGALLRGFTPSFLPCMLAASLAADQERSETLLGKETIRQVVLRSVTLPVQRDREASESLPWSQEPALRVRAVDSVRRSFASPSGSRLLFSAPARFLAVAAGEGRVFVWDLLTQRPLPPLEVNVSAYAFAPACSGGRGSLRLLLVGSPGLIIATFVEASRQEKASGIEGEWDLLFKPSETPISDLAIHALSGQVALLTHDDERLSIWDLATLCAPEVRTLDGREGSPTGPHCVHHLTGRCAAPVGVLFPPDGTQVALLHVGGQLTLHGTERPGLLESLETSAQPPSEEGLLAFSPDGCRLAAGGEHGLLVWKRTSIHEPFCSRGTPVPAEHAPEGGEVLEFTHQGDPVVLTPAGILRWYDWERATLRQEVSLAACEEEPPVRRGRHRLHGGH